MDKYTRTTAREFISDMAEQISLPAVYHQLRELIANPEASIDDYAAVIAQDSMLAVRIIRISKSEYFGFPRQSESLHQAISLIGVLQLHDMLLSCLCMRAFSSIPSEIVNMKAFWEHGVHCAIASRLIAQQCQILSSNQFFTLGLLHEIGHAAMFARAADISLQVLQANLAEQGSMVELEREALGFDYTELGAEIMQLWHLPEAYRQVASYHLHPQHADADYRPAVGIVHLAHSLCQNPVVGAHRDLIDYSAANVPRLNRLPAQIDEMVFKDIDMHAAAVLSMLWPNGAQAVTTAWNN